MADKPLIVAVRHGKTKWNESRKGDGTQRIRGWSDLPLTDEGREESMQTAKGVSVLPIEEIFSSDLKRAEETASFISELTNLPFQITRALRPWGVGYLTGVDVKTALPIMHKFVDDENKKIPGGESFSQFRTRCLSFVKKMCEVARSDGRTICLVCHTRNLQLIRAWIENGAPDDLTIDRKTMDDYSKEIGPSGFITIKPDESLGPDYKETDITADPDKNET